jgi:hypothetical protein
MPAIRKNRSEAIFRAIFPPPMALSGSTKPARGARSPWQHRLATLFKIAGRQPCGAHSINPKVNRRLRVLNTGGPPFRGDSRKIRSVRNPTSQP